MVDTKGRVRRRRFAHRGPTRVRRRNRTKDRRRFLRAKADQAKGGKIVYAWAVEADIDADAIKSNTFEMEWPPRSGKTAHFPEIDRAAWFTSETAKQKINPAQTALIAELLTRL